MTRHDGKLGRIVVAESVRRINNRSTENAPVRRRVMVTVTVLVVLAGIVWGSQVLAAQLRPQRVIIRGCWLTQTQEIIDALEFRAGQSYADINRGIAALEPESVRWLRGVEMERRLPDTVVLTVYERQPLLLVEASDRDFWLCDGGELVRVNPEVDSGETFAGIAANPHIRIRAGVDEGYFTMAEPVLTAAACCCEAMPGVIDIIEITDIGELNLYDNTGFQILLGEPVDLPEKIGALPKALRLSQGDKNKLRYLDARDVDTFYEKWKEPIS